MVYNLLCCCKTIAFNFITLNARFVDYFPRITQRISGINKKAWQFISMICKIYTTTTIKLTDITSPRWGYLIWFDQILGPHGGDFDQKFFWKVKCPTYARGPPLWLNIDRCIMDIVFFRRHCNETNLCCAFMGFFPQGWFEMAHDKCTWWVP